MWYQADPATLFQVQVHHVQAGGVIRPLPFLPNRRFFVVSAEQEVSAQSAQIGERLFTLESRILDRYTAVHVLKPRPKDQYCRHRCLHQRPVPKQVTWVSAHTPALTRFYVKTRENASSYLRLTHHNSLTVFT